MVPPAQQGRGSRPYSKGRGAQRQAPESVSCCRKIGRFAASGAGHFAQAPWALRTWPWTDGRLSNIFVASILGAIAAPLLWIAASSQFGGTAGGFLHLALILGGTSSVLFQLASGNDAAGLLAYATGTALAAALCVGLAAWAHREPTRDDR